MPYEFLWEDHEVTESRRRETWLVMRFLAPAIARQGGTVTFEAASGDMDALCAGLGLKLVKMTGGGVQQIIVTLLDRPLARGARDPSVTQFNASYRIDSGTCEWN